MTAALTEHLIVIHHTDNCGHSSLPFAYDIINKTTRRLIEKQPSLREFFLSFVTTTYKGLQKLTASFCLSDVNPHRHVSTLLQCLASLCEYSSHALRGIHPLIRIFYNIVTTCIPYSKKKKKKKRKEAKATPFAKTIIKLWKIIALVLFFHKET